MRDAHRLSVPEYCAAFEPARKLSESFGFVYGAPFAGYVDDPHGVFMRRVTRAVLSMARPLPCLPRSPRLPVTVCN